MGITLCYEAIGEQTKDLSSDYVVFLKMLKNLFLWLVLDYCLIERLLQFCTFGMF